MALGLPTEPQAIVLLVVAAAVSAVAFWFWWWARARGRTIEDLPTTGAGRVVLGLNEVVGRVSAPKPATAPISGLACVWWEHEFYTQDADGQTRSGRIFTNKASYAA